jgi:ATP-dependent Clp protease ATP-binding subunit ClpA
VALESLTGRAGEVLVIAADEADELGQRSLGPEHILLGLACCERSGAQELLAAAGVSASRVRSRLAGRVDLLPPPEPERRRGDRGYLNRLVRRRAGWSPETRELLASAERRAEASGHSGVTTLHLLAACLESGSGQDGLLASVAADGPAIRADARARLDALDQAGIDAEGAGTGEAEAIAVDVHLRRQAALLGAVAAVLLVAALALLFGGSAVAGVVLLLLAGACGAFALHRYRLSTDGGPALPWSSTARTPT